MGLFNSIAGGSGGLFGGSSGSAGWTPPPQPKKGGGLFGSITNALGSVGHAISTDADKAAHDIQAIPSGIVKMGSDEYKALKSTVQHPWVTGAQKRALLHDWRHPLAPQQANVDKPVAGDVQGMLHSSVASLEHPLRDPFQTLLTLGTVAAPAAKAADVAGIIPAERVLQVPKIVGTDENAAITHAPVALQPAEAPLPRLAQAVHDKLLQRSLDKNVTAVKPTPLAKYAAGRVAKSVSEDARIAQHVRSVPVEMLERSGKHFDKGVPKSVGQHAMFLRSGNVPGDEAATFWTQQAAAGEDTAKLAKTAQRVHDLGLLRLDENDNVAIDAAKYPALARSDALLKENQAARENVILEHGLMTPEDVASRRDLVGKVMAGAEYEKPTPAKLGQPSQGLVRQRAYVQRLQGLYDRASARAAEKAQPLSNVHVRNGYHVQKLKTAPEKALARKYVEVAPGPRTPGIRSAMPAKGLNTPTTERLSAALSVAKDRLEQMEASAARRVRPTGVVGGSDARPGQGYTPLRTSEKAGYQSPIGRGRQPVIPKPKPFSVGKTATGEGIRQGLVPDNTTAGVARATREALRYANTVEHRGMVARLGSDIKRTGDDVLVADPRAVKLGKLDQSDEQLLGRQKSTLGTISEEEHAGLARAMQEKLAEHIPGLVDKFAADKEAGLGTTAPLGYKWVPKQMLGDLTRAAAPRGRIEKAMNNVNSTVTEMTVYFKLSHIPQRLMTNAATSAISGALKPGVISSAIQMRKALSDEEYAKAAAATGTHGYMAMPHEGTAAVAKAATKGAQFYAHRVDSPFRFLNLVHEANKVGIKTPEQFRQLLDAAENPAKATTKERYVLKRSNRVSMMYDGLGENEQRILARGLWFYPWTKAATRYLGHTIAEHPFKAGALGQLGQAGEQVQNSRLGPLPSYEYGLVPFGSGTGLKTSNPGTLLPFTTAGNVLGILARPDTTIQQTNPAIGALIEALGGINQYGEKTNSPIMGALSELVSPTPEAQIVGSYLHPSKPTQMFKNTPLSELARSLAGPTLPRKTSKAALNKDAAHEHERSITVYLP